MGKSAREAAIEAVARELAAQYDPAKPPPWGNFQVEAILILDAQARAGFNPPSLAATHAVVPRGSEEP